MKTLLATLLVCGLTFMAQGRVIPMWPYQWMFDHADLVVVAQPTSTNDTAERTSLPLFYPPINVVGVETKFLVQTVLKGGKAATNTIVLHHFRLADPIRYADEFALVSFDPAQGKSYLLFLKKEADGRFAPVDGQTDPGVGSIIPAERIDLIAIAKTVSPQQQMEGATLTNATRAMHFMHYETELAVQKVLKGDESVNRFVLNRYHDTSAVSGLNLNFKFERDGLYLLLLKKEAEGRFAPITRPGMFGEDRTMEDLSVIILPVAPQ